MPITQEFFGHLPDGREVELYTLTNRNGLEARVMTYGGILVSLKTPDRHGEMGDIVLGFDDLQGYLAGHPYFGSLIGRYGNRIARGQFSLNGVEYRLARNNGPNHLHGGENGFDKVLWKAAPALVDDGEQLMLSYRSVDGEEGYPGQLDVEVTYTLTEDNELKIDYRAHCDRPTILNLTNHSYFNLAGQGDILNHVVNLKASRFLPTDSTLIPTGELRPVNRTPMDFTRPTPIGALIQDDYEPLRFAGGYDHCWIFDKEQPGALEPVAEVFDPHSGREMKVLTTQPAIQFYTGNFLDGTLTGKSGRVYRKHDGFCMETQHYPDAPNHGDFPSTVLNPGEVYLQATVYRFGIRMA